MVEVKFYPRRKQQNCFLSDLIYPINITDMLRKINASVAGLDMVEETHPLMEPKKSIKKKTSFKNDNLQFRSLMHEILTSEGERIELVLIIDYKNEDVNKQLMVS